MYFRVGERAAAAAVRPSCGRVRSEAGSSGSVWEARGSRVREVAAPAWCPPSRPSARATYGGRALCLRPSGRARPTSRWPWVGPEDGRAAEASSKAPGRPAAVGRSLDVVLATCLVAREPGLVHEKGVTPSYLVLCPDGPRPGQHRLHLPKLWLVSRLSHSLVRRALAAVSNRQRCLLEFYRQSSERRSQLSVVHCFRVAESTLLF